MAWVALWCNQIVITVEVWARLQTISVTFILKWVEDVQVRIADSFTLPTNSLINGDRPVDFGWVPINITMNRAINHG